MALLRPNKISYSMENMTKSKMTYKLLVLIFAISSVVCLASGTESEDDDKKLQELMAVSIAPNSTGNDSRY